MSLEQEITKTVKNAMMELFESKRPIMVKKKTIAEMFDVSVDQIDKLIRQRRLIEEVHFTRFTSGGDPMFYVAEVVAELRPKRSKEQLWQVQE